MKIKIQSGDITVESVSGYFRDNHFRVHVNTREKYVGFTLTEDGLLLHVQGGRTLRDGWLVTEDDDYVGQPTAVTFPWLGVGHTFTTEASAGRYAVTVIGVEDGRNDEFELELDPNYPFAKEPS